MTSTELASYLKETQFIADLKSDTKNAVIEELLQPLVDAHLVKSKHLVLMTLKQRETLGSTGIGSHVAIPHCRTLSVSEIHIVAGLSRNGIDFDGIDGKKVQLFFLILAPPQEETNRYLPILGKICELAREKKLREQMIKAQDLNEFIRIIQKGK
ncbi:MAG TPA: PTS sugar transporter subunit IIA [bacterium]|nr:PTS sugar transporter subunit IIA [bacterium]